MTTLGAPRWERFNHGTEALSGGDSHPDRCNCQGTDPTPHKHYIEPPHRCARCGRCGAYTPLIPDATTVAPSGEAIVVAWDGSRRTRKVLITLIDQALATHARERAVLRTALMKSARAYHHEMHRRGSWPVEDCTSPVCRAALDAAAPPATAPKGDEECTNTTAPVSAEEPPLSNSTTSTGASPMAGVTNAADASGVGASPTRLSPTDAPSPERAGEWERIVRLLAQEWLTRTPSSESELSAAEVKAVLAAPREGAR